MEICLILILPFLVGGLLYRLVVANDELLVVVACGGK